MMFWVAGPGPKFFRDHPPAPCQASPFFLGTFCCAPNWQVRELWHLLELEFWISIFHGDYGRPCHSGPFLGWKSLAHAASATLARSTLSTSPGDVCLFSCSTTTVNGLDLAGCNLLLFESSSWFHLASEMRMEQGPIHFQERRDVFSASFLRLVSQVVEDV